MKTKKSKPIAVSEPGLLDLAVRKLSPNRRKTKARYAGLQLVKAGYTVDHRSMSFTTGYNLLEDIPTPARYFARQLLRLGYIHQLKLM